MTLGDSPMKHEHQQKPHSTDGYPALRSAFTERGTES